MAALVARRDGKSHDWTPDKVARPCEPDDVVKALDRLYRQRRIDLTHARILRIWGERQRAPDPMRRSERADARIWDEAMTRLSWPLRVRDIVATPTSGTYVVMGVDVACGVVGWPQTVPTATTTVCG